MIYLFNKIHLKPLALFDNRNKISRIVLTDQIANVNHLSEQNLISLTYGDLYFKENTYADLISKHFNGSDDDFLSWLVALQPNVRLEIYANNDDFFSFLVKFYKTFLINITAESAYLLFRLIYARASNVIGMPHTTQCNFTDRDQTVCQSLNNSMVDHETFVARWNASTVFNPTDQERQAVVRSLSIEFQIATISTYGDVYAYASENKNKVALMGKKWHISMLSDTKSMSLRRLSLLPDFNVQKDTVQEWVKRHPEYAFLDDDNFTEDNVEKIHATYDMAVVKEAYKAQMKRFEYQNVDRIVDDFHFFKTDLTYEDVLQAELDSIYDRQILTRWEYNSYINVYLLDVILNAIRGENHELLHEFSVV